MSAPAAMSTDSPDMVNPAPAVTTIESANAKEPDCPLACIGPAEWMATDSDPTKPNSGAVTDSDSDADTDTRPLAKLALSPTKALKAPPALSPTSCVDRDTDLPEYAERWSEARTVISAPDMSSVVATDTDADSLDNDTIEPDSTDTAPLLDRSADALETDTTPPLAMSS